MIYDDIENPAITFVQWDNQWQKYTMFQKQNH
jgi:hypothetical protein